MRLLAFALSLLLLAGVVEADVVWLSVLVTMTAMGAVTVSFRDPFAVRPRLDARLASFVLSVLLLAGVVEPARDGLVALAAISSVAAFFPGIVSLEKARWGGGRKGHGGDSRYRYAGRWNARHGEDFT